MLFIYNLPVMVNKDFQQTNQVIFQLSFFLHYVQTVAISSVSSLSWIRLAALLSYNVV